MACTCLEVNLYSHDKPVPALPAQTWGFNFSDAHRGSAEMRLKWEM